MLTTIGLVLDIIGAIALVIGLFRHPRPLYPGWNYHPTDAATDHAYGISGGVFLTLGFIGQILGSTGTPHPVPFVRAMVWAAVTMIVGLLLAYVLYGVAFIVSMQRETKWAASHHPDMNDSQWQREPKRLKFWRYSLVT